MTRKNKERFILILIWLFIGSLIFSLSIWKWFGRDYNISFGTMEVDFFNTICGTFGMAGLIIAIYQIAELRNENEIRTETIEQVETKHFKDTAIYNFGSLKPQLQVLELSIVTQIIVSESVINSYIGTIIDVGHTFNIIGFHQKNLTCDALIDCEKLLILQSQILAELYQINNDKSYISFPKQKFIQEIGELITHVSLCETVLKA